MLPITNLEANTFQCWAERFVNYFKSLPGNTVRIIVDNYEKLCGHYFQEVGNKGRERNIQINSLSSHLGLNICRILQSFHSLTGCNLTNPFYGRSKFGSFKTLLKKTVMVEKLSTLSTDAIDIDDVTDFVL